MRLGLSSWGLKLVGVKGGQKGRKGRQDLGAALGTGLEVARGDAVRLMQHPTLASRSVMLR